MKKIIVVFSGGLIKDLSDQWRTTAYVDQGDKFGLDGHRLRLAAAALLWRDEPAAIIVVSGGRGQNQNVPDAPAASMVAKRELLALGVPSEKIFEENRSQNTYDQIVELRKIFSEHRPGTISVVSNDYHRPRIKAMIELADDLRRLFESGRIVLVGADSFLLERDPLNWREVIEKAQTSEAMKQRILLEEKGIADLKKGVYRSTH